MPGQSIFDHAQNPWNPFLVCWFRHLYDCFEFWIICFNFSCWNLASSWYQLISFENTSTLNLHFSGFSVKSIFFVFSRLFKPIIFVFSKPIFVFFREQWHSGSPRLTQTFILLKSIKWVLRISGYLLVKSKLPSPSGSIALNHFLFVLIGFTLCKVAQPTTMHGVTRKRNTEILRSTGNQFRKNPQLKDVC